MTVTDPDRAPRDGAAQKRLLRGACSGIWDGPGVDADPDASFSRTR